MHFQLINITSPNVFKKYGKKYNIFRDLYEVSSFGLEIKNLKTDIADDLRNLILKKGDLSFYSENEDKKSDLLLLGSIQKLKENAKTIKSNISEEIGYKIDFTLNNYTEYDSKSLILGGKKFTLNEIYIVGILNVTPDSFSDGGKYYSKDKAIKHAVKLVDDGADIIDVGGQSTRPGAEEISEEEEQRRVIPVITDLNKMFPEIVISIDTSKSSVAEKAISAGATVVNDISAMTFDSKMINIVKKLDAGVILMHIKGTPATMQKNPRYNDVLSEVYEFLYDRVLHCGKIGINNIIIDPGFGFGKRLTDNYELLGRLNEFKGIGCPILAGISNKSMLSKSLNIKIAESTNASIIAETIAVKNGARFIRTHNVKNAVQLKKIRKFEINPELLLNV